MGRPAKILSKEWITSNSKILPNGCWQWTGQIRKADGYSKFRYKEKTFYGHIFSYQTFKGEILKGLQLDHLCRNRACVNPDHLEPVTPLENVLRGFSPSSINSRKKHCDHGHEFNEKNTYMTPDGRRQCRICNYFRTKKSQENKRAA